MDGFNGTPLIGWARQRDLHLPVHVTLFRDDVPVRNAYAEERRLGLLQAGMDTGNYGFSIELADLGFAAASRITVRIAGRPFTLNNSGSTIGELGGNLERLGNRTGETVDLVDAGLSHLVLGKNTLVAVRSKMTVFGSKLPCLSIRTIDSDPPSFYSVR